MYFKRCQSAPTNSISCGRPLPNIPLLYSVPSLSLLLLHFHSYPLCAFSLLPDIDLYFSSLLFVFSPHTYASVHKFAQQSTRKNRTAPNNCYSTPQSFTIMLSHARDIRDILFFHTGLSHSGLFSWKVRWIDFADLLNRGRLSFNWFVCCVADTCVCVTRRRVLAASCTALPQFSRKKSPHAASVEC